MGPFGYTAACMQTYARSRTYIHTVYNIYCREGGEFCTCCCIQLSYYIYSTSSIDFGMGPKQTLRDADQGHYTAFLHF